MTHSSIQLGPFELDHVIGRGGMGEVWKGRHVSQNVPVAVKVLTERAARRDDYLRQFRNETRAVAGLDHPGIVVVFDHGEVTAEAAEASGDALVAGSPYLVMELARHGALDGYLDGMTWGITTHILFTVLDALSHAHARGVVHRDLKPQNMLLGCARQDGLGLKLADFGLAHPMDLEGRTEKYEQGWGTPNYMAPEQFRGLFRDFGPYTDLYALGCVAWELTTGELLYEGANVIELSGMHLHGDLPEFEPRFEVPDGFERWLRRLLQKDFRQRFQTAADAAWALSRLLRQRKRGAEPERILAGDEAQTVPVRAGQGETKLLTHPDTGSEADTVPERVSTTLLLPDKVAPSKLATRTVTIDVSQWMKQPRSGDGAAAEGREASTGALADIELPPLPEDWRQPETSDPSPQLLGAGLGLYGLRAVRMVDRDDERDRLWEELHRVKRRHEARVCVLEGRAGTGKSRLARWLCERAEEVGAAKVLDAVHSPVSGPADGLSGMVARHFGCVGLQRADVRHRLRDVLSAEGVTEPYEWNALTELISPASDDDEGEGRVRFTTSRQRYALLRRVVERLARRRPIILWLDDVQWGGDAIGFAEHLLDIQRSTRSPILMLLTARTEALGERPIERAQLERLVRADQSDLLRVEPLQREDTSELVRRLLMLDGKLAEQVEARSAGNPLFAVQLVGDWVTAGKLTVGRDGFRLQRGETARIPDNIHQLWQERIEQLVSGRSDYARLALELAAALGQEVEQEEWDEGCRILGLDAESDLEEALLARGLVRPIDGGWRFVHGMLRESLERLSREADRWQWLNSTCAEVLVRLYGADHRAKAERRARYLLESERRQDAIHPLLIAARFRAGRSEFGAAHALLDHREEIVEANADGEPTPQFGSGWVLRSEILELEGQFGRALRYARRAVDDAREHGWNSLLAPALRATARAHLHLGDFDRAEACCEEAKGRLDPEFDACGYGLTLLVLGRVAQSRGDFEQAKCRLERAVELLEQTEDEQGRARCYNALGDIARQTRRLTEARSYAEQARALFDAAGNQVGVADCLNDLSELNHQLGDDERAEQLCVRALHLYESAGSHQSMRVRLNLAFILLHRGEFDEARSVLAEARQHFEREEQLAELARADVLLLTCATADADWQIWDDLYEEATRLVEQTGLRAPRMAHAATIAAELAREAGSEERSARAAKLGGRVAGEA